MMEDQLKTQLRRWGYAVVTRYASNDDGPRTGNSVLSRSRELAPGTRENYRRQVLGRNGDSRLRMMAKATEVPGLRKLPFWSCDPMPAKNDADAPHDRAAVVDLGIPDDLRWIDDAIRSLSRQYPVRASVLREEFCGTGTQRMKAGRVQRGYGGTLSIRQYRYELSLGLEWLRGKVAS